MRSSSVRFLLTAGTMLLAAGLLPGCGSSSEDTAAASSAAVENSQTSSSESVSDVGLEFPYEADEGRLVIESLFSSDVTNPDSDNASAEGIASLAFRNVSGDFLRSAVFYVTMTDGTERTFKAEAVPDGAVDWAFEIENQTMDLQQAVEDVSFDTVYGAYENSVMDLVSLVITDTQIQLTNNSDQVLTNLKVYCHNDLGEAYYGGTVYTYTVESVSPGETVTIDAAECYLGVSVVDIATE